KQAKLNSTIIFPDPSGEMSWLQIKDSINTKDKISIFIGPEGGFTKEEVELAKNENAFILNLGERILRAETAAISVASMVRFCVK
ncbi:RNA methyltransferase, partial [bacterium]|nr:RNA methyltransferase [bacterium]